MQAKVGGAESKMSDPAFAAEGEDFSLEHAQLLTEGTDIETEVVPERKKPLRQVRNPKENGVMAPDL